jgi:hypothetical protein
VTEQDVVERIQLPADAGLVQSLGAHHTLESAIADLVDNSLDAGARHVVVRLLTESDRLTQVEIIDNGLGMDAQVVTDAMTIGHQRKYAQQDLGHFGMGLKAASLSQADTLTVWSKSSRAVPVGRRIRRPDYAIDFSCEVLSDEAAEAAESERARILDAPSGTMIVLTDIRNAYRGRGSAEARTWLSTTISGLRTHLGVVFHRLLAQGLELEVVVDEVEAIAGAVPVPVLPIDPFDYRESGHPRYPKDLIATAAGRAVALQCHIWPARSDQPGFRIGGKPGEQFQGFFIYRNDRLLQIGGWSETANPSRERQLARVVLDDPAAIGAFVTMNPEKSGMRFEPVFHDAVSHAAASDGMSFMQFLAEAESTYSEATRRRRKRSPAITPDKGFGPELRRAIRNELPMIAGDTLRVQWTNLPEGEFFDVDLHTKTLWLNGRYRPLFAPAGGSLNDSPVLKGVLYLLTHSVFEGQYLGAKDKDDISLWKGVLGAAAESEWRMKHGDDGR